MKACTVGRGKGGEAYAFVAPASVTWRLTTDLFREGTLVWGKGGTWSELWKGRDVEQKENEECRRERKKMERNSNGGGTHTCLGTSGI